MGSKPADTDTDGLDEHPGGVLMELFFVSAVFYPNVIAFSNTFVTNTIFVLMIPPSNGIPFWASMFRGP